MKAYWRYYGKVLRILPALMVYLLACTPHVSGELVGTVTIGPLSPVQQIGMPAPTPPPEVYTSRGLNIYHSDGQTLYAQLKFQPDGTFSIFLPAGVYVIALIPNGIDHAEGLPETIRIEEGKTTTLAISIDTGIR
jgi:hypothetical protein